MQPPHITSWATGPTTSSKSARARARGLHGEQGGQAVSHRVSQAGQEEQRQAHRAQQLRAEWEGRAVHRRVSRQRPEGAKGLGIRLQGSCNGPG